MTAALAPHRGPDVLAGFTAGESVPDLAIRFGCPPSEIEAVLRSRLAQLRASTHASRHALAMQALTFTSCRQGVTVKAAIESRDRPAVLARWAAWLALMGLGWSKSAIARTYGLDRTTILAAARRAPSELAQLVEAATADLRARPT